MSLINCKISFMLNCSEKKILIAYTVANQAPTFTITYTKSYVPVVTLSTQDNVKLLEQLKTGFKRTTNRNKYQSYKTTQAQK